MSKQIQPKGAAESLKEDRAPRRHSPVRTALAVSACKQSRKLLRKLHRGGTDMPGKIAMKFDHAILETVSAGMEIIVVTGTNGKTTTSRMLEQAMTASGKDTLCNKSGANLLSGVTAEFCVNADRHGNPKKHYAIVECDEAALKQIVPFLHPKVILVTNLFRDQLDRYGEVMHTLEQIRIGVKKVPESILCLNADCSLTSSLALDVPNKVVYYGIDTPVGPQTEAAVSDARRCIRCGTEYHYSYHTYAHLGGFACPKCGYARTEPATAVTAITSVRSTGTDVQLKLTGPDGAEERRDAHIALPAIYNVYNAVSAICAYTAAGFPADEIISELAKVSSSFGRMETFTLGEVPIQMILVKNPAGCNQALEYLNSLSEDFNAVFCLNDNTPDGHDISWIWDADYENVCGGHMKHVLVSGIRADDMFLRLKYAGLPEEQMEIVRSNAALIEKLRGSTLPVFILPNYTSMLRLRSDLSAATGKQDYWKGDFA